MNATLHDMIDRTSGEPQPGGHFMSRKDGLVMSQGQTQAPSFLLLPPASEVLTVKFSVS